MMRLRLAVHVVLLTLLATALAGCSNAPAQSEGPGELKYDYMDSDNKTHGFVAGIVLNEAGEPVPDVVVMILSVDGSARTDSAGTFEFTGVAKGEQTLRVEKQGYKTLQRPFTVAAGKIVELEVVLAPADGLRGGAIDHYHDHWRGQDLYSIYDGRIEFGGDMTQSPGPCLTGPSCQAYPLALETGRIVPPGTVRISIDISFDPGPTFDQEGWRFAIYPPPGPLGEEYDAKSWYLTSGEEHLEYDLPSSRITDHGHASYTNWGFVLVVYNYAREAWPAAYNTLFPDSVDITITAHKGDLVIDPPHPQYWADADRIEMPTGPATKIACTTPGVSHPWLCEPRSPNPPVSFGGSDEPRSCWVYPDLQEGCMVLDRGGLVPPGTTRVSFDFEMWQTSSVQGTEPPVDDTDWVLGFKTAAPPREGATWDDYTWVEPVEAYDPEPQAGRYHQQGHRYVIQVPAGGEDPYYSLYSGWVFMMAVRGHETASDYSDVSCSTNVCGYPYFQMKNFFVHNDSPTALDMEPE